MLYKYVPYSKMKIGVEDAIKSLGFENAVVLRPGMILGEREGGEHKSWVLEVVLGNLNRVSQGLQDAVGMSFASPLSFFFFFRGGKEGGWGLIDEASLNIKLTRFFEYLRI